MSIAHSDYTHSKLCISPDNSGQELLACGKAEAEPVGMFEQ